jgi:ABC-2 type transport system ATP-binding protein
MNGERQAGTPDATEARRQADSAAPVIEIAGLRKSFGRKTVLAGVDLRVPRGAVFGFLGLNGAGKTTLIQILLGLARADGGQCRVLGLDPARQGVEIRRRVGYMAENQAMYGWMRVREIIDWAGRFHPTWDRALADGLRQQMELAANAKVGTLSKGQTSKLALLLALAHRPEFVILDDPVLGLDPLARRDFLRDVVGQLQARDVTVFFSSHLLYEIEPICDYVAILHDGHIVAADTVDALRARVKRVELRAPAVEAHAPTTAERAPAAAAHAPTLERLRTLPTLLDVHREGEHWSVTVADIAAARPALQQLGANGMVTQDLNLDEIFEAYVAGRTELPA